MALPKTFTGGERLFADDLNSNFENLDTRTAGAEADIDAIQANYTDAGSLTSGTVPTARFPAGVVLQVLQGTSSSTSTITSGSFTDTGVTVSITPSSTSSKVLVNASLNFDIDAGTDNDVTMETRLVRDTTEIIKWREGQNGFTGRLMIMSTNSKLDSPATDSAVTYKVQARLVTTGNSRSIEVNRYGATSSITVMEVAG